MKASRPIVLTLFAGLLLASGCSAGSTHRVKDAAYHAQAAASPQPPPVALTENHFRRDQAGSLSEADIHHILDAPVSLQPGARIGVVQVAAGYNVEMGLPLTGLTASLGHTLEDTGLFEVASEVSTDWPATRQIAGLRELAARYRCEYLLLYRHRFVDESHANPWTWAYLTGVGIFIAPARTLEVRGVLEATLFDVRTGTILVTVFERVEGTRKSSGPSQRRNLRELEESLLMSGTEPLAQALVEKVNRIATTAEGRASESAPSPPVVRVVPES